MEPYRPLVDKLVFEIVRENDLWVMDTGMKARLLSIPALDVTINGMKSPLMVATTITTASVAKCFNGETRQVVYPTVEL